jgi:membrane-bound lytic murein transglycosylase F
LAIGSLFQILNRRQYILLALSTALILAGCNLQAPKQGSVLREAQEKGVLKVVTTNAPTTYYRGRDGVAGFEYDLINAYAQYLGVTAEFNVAPSIDTVLEMVATEQVDIAAAGLSITAERKKKYLFGSAYMSSDPIVVCRRGVRKVDDLSELIGLRFVLAGSSSFAEMYQSKRKERPELPAAVISPHSVEVLFTDIVAKRLDCTIADDHVFALHRRYMPTLERRISAGQSTPLAWVIAGGKTWRGISMSRELKHWMSLPETVELIDLLKMRYFAVSDNEFDYVDLSRLKRAMSTRLPKYQNYFEQAGERYKLPWTLLAALSWRESHWKVDATSYTGVRGLMMLTRITAKEQGVSDRLDPEQSINGGARYLASLLRRLPDSIDQDHRYPFALLAYNIGWGHMIDARTLVSQRNGDPDNWQEVSAILPELENPEVYKTLKFGYARGREGQAYVAAVINFADIIEKAHAPIIETPQFIVVGAE